MFCGRRRLSERISGQSLTSIELLLVWGLAGAGFINSRACSARIRPSREHMEIEGKRVLVTGASRGLGRALVTAFVDAGASEVLAGARKREDREALKSEHVTPVRLDVTSDEDVGALARLGPIDILD